MSATFTLGRYRVGPGQPPFVIAEMSGNHNGSLERALAIVDAAAAAGAHALKIQTYTADTITLNVKTGEFFISDPNSPWKGQSLYELYQKAHTPWDWHKPIFERARNHGLVAFSSPFDDTAVDWLEELDVPCYKIASFENVHLPLIRKAAATKKPLIISTGMATQDEIGEAVEAARGAGCKDLVLLKCTSSYPASPEFLNLATISDMRQRYSCQIGLSDHTPGIGAAVASVALGATVIEKHFTLSRADGGVDSAFSLEPAELKLLVDETARAQQALGTVSYGLTETEEKSRVFRRSLYIAQDIRKGEILTKDNLRAVRPGYGLPPKHYDRLLGRRVNRDAQKGTPVSWDLVGNED